MPNLKTGNSIRLRAWRAVDMAIANGQIRYDRQRLSRLIPIGPDKTQATGREATRFIIGRLAHALRSERSRGKAGHWTYDLNRHIGLAQAHAAEKARLRQEASGD